jgi:nucleoside-diphosphate-sugar epimerase
VINLGCGQEVSIRDLVERIHKLTGSRSKLRIGALADRPGEIRRMFADARKAGRLLDWFPRVGLEEGLARTIEWYRRFVDEYAGSESGLARLGA